MPASVPPVLLTERFIFSWRACYLLTCSSAVVLAEGFYISHSSIFITKTLISSPASVFPAKPWLFKPPSRIFSQWMLLWPWAWPWSSIWVHGTHNNSTGSDALSCVHYIFVMWPLQVSYINLLFSYAYQRHMAYMLSQYVFNEEEFTFSLEECNERTEKVI